MTEHYDVLVIGAGPAGLAAASTAAAHGVRVGLLDAQARPGGQVWRHDVRKAAPRAARESIAALGKVTLLAQHSVIAHEGGALRVETPQGSALLGYNALVLATGARELLLPFPGWTLPGVTGAGGLQALAGGRQARGRRRQRAAAAGCRRHLARAWREAGRHS